MSPQSGSSYATNLSDIQEAQRRIADHATYTPILTCSSLDDLVGCKLHFKCETFQKGGAFKFRGACNAVLSLSNEQARAGVVTHSSGNHAAALALAASQRGMPAHIIVPRTAPACKLAAVRASCTGTLYLCEPSMAAREQLCAEVQQRTGATFIPPYNCAPVISGQGTVALELLEQCRHLDVIIAPVSGGGLISGIAIAAKALRPDITIFAAEPVGRNNAADAAASKAAGRLVVLDKPDTIADGLQARLGSLTWPVVRDLVDEVITVTEEEIVSATRHLFETAKLVVEPSGAASLAAALSLRFKAFLAAQKTEQHVGVVLSGGNMELVQLCKLQQGLQ